MTDLIDEQRRNALGRQAARLVACIEKDLAAQQTVDVDITPAQKAVLIQLETTGNRITTLAQRLGTSKQAASKLVQEIENKGLVVRLPDPEDGRASVIQFTDKGRAIVDTTVSYFEELERQIAAEIGHEDLALVKAKLKRIADFLDPHGF